MKDETIKNKEINNVDLKSNSSLVTKIPVYLRNGGFGLDQDLLSRIRELQDGFSLLRASIEGRTPDLVIHGKKFRLVEKDEAARHLSISIDTFDRCVRKGYLPQPYSPEQKSGNGNKLLRWDLYAVIEQFTSYRTN